MSNNSRHSFKMQKRFDKEETARREQLGNKPRHPLSIHNWEQIGEILEATRSPHP